MVQDSVPLSFTFALVFSFLENTSDPKILASIIHSAEASVTLQKKKQLSSPSPPFSIAESSLVVIKQIK